MFSIRIFLSSFLKNRYHLWPDLPFQCKDRARSLHTNQKRSIQIWTLKFIREEMGKPCAKFNYWTMVIQLSMKGNLWTWGTDQRTVQRHLQIILNPHSIIKFQNRHVKLIFTSLYMVHVIIWILQWLIRPITWT